MCHTPIVDNALTYGIGHHLDGRANRDLDLGKIVSLEMHGIGRFFDPRLNRRFRTLLDVANHHDACKKLALTDRDKQDLVEYLKSLPESAEQTKGKGKGRATEV